MDLEALLRDAIVRVCDVPPESVRPETELDALGVDSLASAEIIFELEMKLQRQFPNQVLKQVDEVRTVGDVAKRLQTALDERITGPSSLR